ncbi:hypothetical protein N7462_000124 [Penicillium macrosclerotiorum]|uniref:uncharacterized protein n=1 Tax=Penicillium macrosclerotiorum TaxID=303699 RepID=UPI0025472141|nr:uncharacterized protein N7462_000124 [Penicillium macrosclerotiorum]KAJ5698119.1 hypothetical protein N7462_000124 [Penicillium macrosclerotiorum]
MRPSSANVADFQVFVPGVDAGTALLFLESASSINEAVDQYYENPGRYSRCSSSIVSTIHSPIDPASSRLYPSSISTSPEATMQANSPPSYPSPPPSRASVSGSGSSRSGHTNALIKAATLRAKDEQEMQNMLQTVQQTFHVFNPEIEPEHECQYPCNCLIHKYLQRKVDRLDIQEMWSKAVMYPGEKAYHDCAQVRLFNNNPYQSAVVSPYGFSGSTFYGMQRPDPHSHAKAVQQTIELNNSLNSKSQTLVDAQEPAFNIWEVDQLQSSMFNIGIGTSSAHRDNLGSKSKRASLKKALSIKSSADKVASKTSKLFSEARELQDAILQEEDGRWPEQLDRDIVSSYQTKVGMAEKIAECRAKRPLQYLHLLRAGYFEPIPVAWAGQASNPLKFTIDGAAGWRGITPAWRGYEDTAEERLYWVLNHRLEDPDSRLKPDLISALNMARARMARAVKPPPTYYSISDICRQNSSQGYSDQVMPRSFHPFDPSNQQPDNTMILLDVSGSMDFQPRRPEYNEYLITSYTRSAQPKNKGNYFILHLNFRTLNSQTFADLAKAIIGRFIDAMGNHDHNWSGYELTTFASQAEYIGVINHWNLDEMWQTVRFGGRTRVMAGWQRVKELHFQKHSDTATYHPVYGWQAGPQTPMLRLLLILDGEARDMDEFELDLLSLSWAHVTIFLIGVDRCLHHHRHANELQRIGEVNPHVSFIDAQGNAPERFITHELLKRHLGYELSLDEFEDLEHAPGDSRRAELPALEPPPPNLPELEQPPPPSPVELPALETLPSQYLMEQPPPYSASA